MQKIFTFLWSLGFVCLASAQTEFVTGVTVGGSFDYVNPPISAQSQFSHSQTIYTAQRLGFRGTITSISYFLIFTNSSLENSGQWKIRIGTTDKTEFTDGEAFIPDSETTEVFNLGSLAISGTEIKLVFSQPFEYDGQSNLVIDVREVQPGVTSSGLTGFVGREDFFNPPKITMMSFSDGDSAPVLYENSIAQTKFGGNLEKCAQMYSANFTNVETTTADATWGNPNNVPAFRYTYAPAEEPMPETYTVTPTPSTSLQDLTPATLYNFYWKADCDISPAGWVYSQFTTKPNPLTLPTTISFDGESDHNYLMTAGFHARIGLSPDAGTDGSTGVRMAGNPNALNNPWVGGNDTTIWTNNPTYVSKLHFDIDLTNSAGNPVLKFDLRQNSESRTRIRINNIVQPFEYLPVTQNEDGFETISIDLSQQNGTFFSLDIEHLGRFTPTDPTFTPYSLAYIDNVRLVEESCDRPANLAFSAGENQLTLNWESSAGNFETAFVARGQMAPVSGQEASGNSRVFENLDPAKAYDFYVRSVCGDGKSGWIKQTATTLPLAVTVPFEQYQTAFTVNGAPQYNNSSDIFFYGSRLILYSKNAGDIWVGGNATTEEQAWNDNRAFVSGMKFRMDATNVENLECQITLKQQYYYTPNTSWFRVLVNGEQFGPSRQANTASNDPNQTLTLDLAAYTGGIVDVTLESVGKFESNFSEGSHMNLTRISRVQFSGTLGTEDFSDRSLTVSPNPTADLIHIESADAFETVSIFDNSGRLVKQFEVRGISGDFDLRELQTGTYFVQITGKVGSKTVKVVKI